LTAAVATARFHFHGEVCAFLARERRAAPFDCACARAATLKQAIEALGVPHTEVGRLLVNGEPATLARIVREGDTIEAFPHAAGEAPLVDEARFLADAHLGGLARMLRMLGFDTLYDNAFCDRAILELAARERRVVLTRDRELLKCRELLRGCFVHARKPEDQLREVVARYGLERRMRPFTLCLHCNLRLAQADRHKVAGRVPARIESRYHAFACCPGCRRIFWEGSHWARMREILRSALAPAPGVAESMTAERAWP
jgi:uncharacterized protein with PIN domain